MPKAKRKTLGLLLGPGDNVTLVKPVVKVIVSMHGGCVQQVEVDPANPVQLHVVFTEAAKYGRDEGEALIYGGRYEGDIIYTQQESELSTAEDIAAVFKAAKRRKKGA